MKKTTLLITILMLVSLVLVGAGCKEKEPETEKIGIPIIDKKIKEDEELMERCCKECFDLRTNIYPDMCNLWEYNCSEFKGFSKKCQTFFDQYFTLGGSYGECMVKSSDLEKYALSSFLDGLKEKYGNKKWTGTISGKCLRTEKELEKIMKYSQEHEYTMTINEMKIDFDSLASEESILSSNPTIPLIGSATVNIGPETCQIFDVPSGDILSILEYIPINNPIPFKFVGEIWQYGAGEGMTFSFHPIDDYKGKLMVKERGTVFIPPPGGTVENILSRWLNDLGYFCPMTMTFKIEGQGLMEKMIIEHESGGEEAEGELHLSE